MSLWLIIFIIIFSTTNILWQLWLLFVLMVIGDVFPPKFNELIGIQNFLVIQILMHDVINLDWLVYGKIEYISLYFLQIHCKSGYMLLLHRILIHICYFSAGRSVLGKTVPEVLSTCQDREHSFFPKKDRPRPVNKVFLSGKLLYKRYLCWFFTEAVSHRARAFDVSGSSKPVLFTEAFQRRDSVFADFRTEQWRIYISWRFLV